MTNLRLFHYTTASHLKQIIEAGQILPADLYVPVGERPAVWLSKHPHWEPTASKGIIAPDGTRRTATFGEMVELDTPYRIEVTAEAGPLNWREWSLRSGVRKKIAKALRGVAERQGSLVVNWRMNLEPIKRLHWLAVEVFADGEWKPIAF